MPTVSAFRGVKVQLFWDEHPPPHFHVLHGGDDCSLVIDTLDIMEGELPPRILAMVRAWAREHRAELIEGWNQCRELLTPAKILPPTR